MNPSVCLVAFAEQDNMGIGYLASVLLQHNYKPHIIDYRLGRERILAAITAAAPVAVGFSIIFQHHILDFRSLIRYLRESGVEAHFSAGGHYPSLRYQELLDVIPDLDSVVLFEGEHTFLELVDRLTTGYAPWRDTDGIAYLRNGVATANRLRPLEPDLDEFPPPVRGPAPSYVLGKKYATILAGRGCVYDCSFCSIREFYSKPPGALKRIRRPEMVVREMELLAEERGCSLFMFQDDDFPVAYRGGEWVAEFCRLLHTNGMADRILWKISCRSDEIKPEILAAMQKAGLFLVYLGIESGNADGLALMRKHIAPEANVKAVDTLNRLGIAWDFGFMLLDPASTWRTVRQNMDFLNKICAGGVAPVTFCKMLPYAETRIEADLRRAGRLTGPRGFEDYNFLDPSLDRFFAFASECFGEWIGGAEGMLNYSRWAHYYPPVCRRFFPDMAGIEEFDKAIRRLIAETNLFLLDGLTRLADAFEQGTATHTLLQGMQAETTDAQVRYRRAFDAVFREIKESAKAIAAVPA